MKKNLSLYSGMLRLRPCSEMFNSYVCRRPHAVFLQRKMMYNVPESSGSRCEPDNVLALQRYNTNINDYTFRRSYSDVSEFSMNMVTKYTPPFCEAKCVW